MHRLCKWVFRFSHVCSLVKVFVIFELLVIGFSLKPDDTMGASFALLNFTSDDINSFLKLEKNLKIKSFVFSYSRMFTGQVLSSKLQFHWQLSFNEIPFHSIQDLNFK